MDDRDPCMAFLLARTRTDEEVYLLVAMFSIRTKSRRARVFHRANLEEPSFKLAMRNARVDVEKVLRKLVRDGFLEGGGPVGKFVTTDAGNCVKHVFHESRADWEVEGVAPSVTRSLAFVEVLRREVLRRCAEREPELARRIGGGIADRPARDEE